MVVCLPSMCEVLGFICSIRRKEEEKRKEKVGGREEEKRTDRGSEEGKREEEVGAGMVAPIWLDSPTFTCSGRCLGVCSMALNHGFT